MNTYEYVGGSPAEFVDPTGQDRRGSNPFGNQWTRPTGYYAPRSEGVDLLLGLGSVVLGVSVVGLTLAPLFLPPEAMILMELGTAPMSDGPPIFLAGKSPGAVAKGCGCEDATVRITHNVDPNTLMRTHNLFSDKSARNVLNISRDMKANGYNNNYPIIIKTVDGVPYIVNGHHRRYAAVMNCQKVTTLEPLPGNSRYFSPSYDPDFFEWIKAPLGGSDTIHMHMP